MAKIAHHTGPLIEWSVQNEIGSIERERMRLIARIQFLPRNSKRRDMQGQLRELTRRQMELSNQISEHLQ